jgi:hypothetical protein
MEKGRLFIANPSLTSYHINAINSVNISEVSIKFVFPKSRGCVRVAFSARRRDEAIKPLKIERLFQKPTVNQDN